jgi:hypothetical protein
MKTNQYKSHYDQHHHDYLYNNNTFVSSENDEKE